MERIRAEADAQVSKEHALAEERLRQARQQADEQFKAECKRLAEEQEAMTANFAKLRSQMQKERTQLEQQSKSLARECSLKQDENEALKKRTQEFLAERNRLAEAPLAGAVSPCCPPSFINIVGPQCLCGAFRPVVAAATANVTKGWRDATLGECCESPSADVVGLRWMGPGACRWPWAL